MVLSHLILNGMVKVKGQIYEMAKCVEDPDIRIADLAKLFFSELSTKDNAVYNNLPDIISGLSNPTTGVDQQTFNTIMKFLFSFISKEKQTENLVEKLCQRFKGTNELRQWRDISFCLSMLNCSAEKSIKKLVENIPLYQEALNDPEVFKHFTEVLSKARKFQKAELKTLLDDYEKKIQDIHEKGITDPDAAAAAPVATTKTATKRGILLLFFSVS